MSESALEAMSLEELLVMIRDLLRINAEQQRRIEFLEREMAKLRGGPPSDSTSGETKRELPAFVKPNTGKDKGKDGSDDETQPKAPRKKRPHGFVRRREEPTQVVEHAADQCSGCGRKLSGGWMHSSRQVIEIPPVPV